MKLELSKTEDVMMKVMVVKLCSLKLIDSQTEELPVFPLFCLPWLDWMLKNELLESNGKVLPLNQARTFIFS